MSIFTLCFLWDNCLTTENLMKSTEKILVVVLGSRDTISTSSSVSTMSVGPIPGFPDGMWRFMSRIHPCMSIKN